MKPENTVVIGASPKEERYSYKAIKMLAEKGHNPIPVAKVHKEILGKKAYPSLSEIPDKIDTVTMYLGAQRQEPVINEILKIKPKRVIFNPGAENPNAYDSLKNAGIEPVEACTLVLLRTEQY